MVTDAQYEAMGVAIGHAAKLRSVLAEKTAGSEAAKKDQIRELVSRIKNGEVKKKTKKGSKKSGEAKVEKKVKEKNIHMGWLHRSHPSKSYAQIRKKGGGTIRKITYTDEDQITVDFLIAEGKRMFLTEETSQYGRMDRMQIELGNFDQKAINKFTDTDGNECSYGQYLRNRGLFPSRAYVYLLTTSPSVAESSTHGVKDESEAHLNCESENNEAASGASSPSLPLLGVAVECEQFAEHGYQDQNILIEYEHVSESSYSEVLVTSLSYSRNQCYELTSFEDPTVQDTLLQDFEPLENGFKVVSISKPKPEHRSFIQRFYDPSNIDDPCKSFVTPCATESAESVILYHPSEVWGYDESQLVLGVVTAYHNDPVTFYTWYNDDNILKSGPGLCCIAVNSPGKYCVKVQNADVSDLSKPIWVRPLRSPESKKRKTSKQMSDNTKHLTESAVSSQLPQIRKEDVTFLNEIGRGAFGVVYKGEWSGTVIAVKVIKARNAKRLRSVLETEVSVHCRIRHPNIVQIMAISILKNSVYLISEFIDGPNMERVLFPDDMDGLDQDTRSNILSEKVLIGKQTCQAVAYLHNLKSPIIHRDIKPANILIDKKSHIAKLCDMGISRLKKSCASTITSTQADLQGMPGTPSYMAPECLLEHKPANIQSDIWSLGCTLVELLSEEDCWQDLLEEDQIDVQSVLVNKKRPSALGKLGSPVVAACFNYDPAMRPSAIELISAL